MADTNQQQSWSGINDESERKNEKGEGEKVACPLYALQNRNGDRQMNNLRNLPTSPLDPSYIAHLKCRYSYAMTAILSIFLLVSGLSAWGGIIEKEPIVAKLKQPFHIYTIAVSPDGKRLAVGGLGHRLVNVWNLQTRKLVTTLEGKGMVKQLAYTPDGKFLVAGRDMVGRAKAPAIKVWDAKSGLLVSDIMGPYPEGSSGNNVYGMTASNDRDLLAIVFTSPEKGAGKVDKIYIYDLSIGKFEAVNGTNKVFSPLSFIDKNSKLVVSTIDNELKIVDVKTGKVYQQFNAVGYPDRIAVSKDSQVIVTGSEVYIKNNGWQRISFKPNSGSPKAIVFSPDSKYIVTTGEDKLVQIWDGKSFKLLMTLTGHTEYGNALAFTPDSSQLIVGGQQLITIWDFNKIEATLSKGRK